MASDTEELHSLRLLSNEILKNSIKYFPIRHKFIVLVRLHFFLTFENLTSLFRYVVICTPDFKEMGGEKKNINYGELFKYYDEMF